MISVHSGMGADTDNEPAEEAHHPQHQPSTPESFDANVESPDNGLICEEHRTQSLCCDETLLATLRCDEPLLPTGWPQEISDITLGELDEIEAIVHQDISSRRSSFGRSIESFKSRRSMMARRKSDQAVWNTSPSNNQSRLKGVFVGKLRDKMRAIRADRSASNMVYGDSTYADVSNTTAGISATDARTSRSSRSSRASVGSTKSKRSSTGRPFVFKHNLNLNLSSRDDHESDIICLDSEFMSSEMSVLPRLAMGNQANAFAVEIPKVQVASWKCPKNFLRRMKRKHGMLMIVSFALLPLVIGVFFCWFLPEEGIDNKKRHPCSHGLGKIYVEGVSEKGCESCKAGYHLKDETCLKNECYCPHGRAAVLCPQDGAILCE